jgi:hypothetical protein
MKDTLHKLGVAMIALGISQFSSAPLFAQSQTPAPPKPPRNSAASPVNSPASASPPAEASDFRNLEGKRLSVPEMLANLPRQVTSKPGTRGDMVNLLIVGTKQQVADAFNAAGWVQADKSTEDAIVHAIEETMNHTAYSEMPMSQLYLFGRPQDFGFVEGMPIQIVTERNHFRLWRAPWLDSAGRTVWAGAGTHDVGIEKDSAGQLTHRIDPDVDREREYILETLQGAGKVASSEYFAPKNPVQQALTATGDVYRSDGRILVIYLK